MVIGGLILRSCMLMGDCIQLKSPSVKKKCYIKLFGYGFVPFVGRLGPEVASTFFFPFPSSVKVTFGQKMLDKVTC